VGERRRGDMPKSETPQKTFPNGIQIMPRNLVTQKENENQVGGKKRKTQRTKKKLKRNKSPRGGSLQRSKYKGKG